MSEHTIPSSDVERRSLIGRNAGNALGFIVLGAGVGVAAAMIPLRASLFVPPALAALALVFLAKRPYETLMALSLFLLVALPYNVTMYDMFGFNLIVGSLKFYYDELLLGALLSALAVQFLLSADLQRRLLSNLLGRPIGLCLLLCVAVTAAVIGRSAGAWGAKSAFSDGRFILAYLSYVPFCLAIGDRPLMRRLWKYVLAGAGAHCVVLVILLAGRNSYASFLATVQAYDPYGAEIRRIGFPNILSFPNFAVPLAALWMVGCRREINGRILALLGLIALTWVISSNRSLLVPLLAVLLGLSAIALVKPGLPKKAVARLVLLAVLLAVVGGLLYFAMPAFRVVATTAAERLGEASDPGDVDSLRNRLSTMAFYAGEVVKRPWTGYGFGSKMSLFNLGEFGAESYTIDFGFLVLAYKGGLPLLLPFLLLFGLPFLLLARLIWRSANPKHQFILYGLAGGLAATVFATAVMNATILIGKPTIVLLMFTFAFIEHLAKDPEFFAEDLAA
ncbi:MAG: hypothetical protein NTW86_27230 [Candidatus Sumerlaeota bacterium]|nr:hypothetical protein [Candidatus Sumerlaeota bacterium]